MAKQRTTTYTSLELEATPGLNQQCFLLKAVFAAAITFLNYDINDVLFFQFLVQ